MFDSNLDIVKNYTSKGTGLLGLVYVSWTELLRLADGQARAMHKLRQCNQALYYRQRSVINLADWSQGSRHLKQMLHYFN